MSRKHRPLKNDSGAFAEMKRRLLLAFLSASVDQLIEGSKD